MTTKPRPSGALKPESGLVFVSSQSMVRIASNQSLMALLGESPADMSVFEESAPFFFEAVISTDRLDSYFTHMNKRTLRNYADEAKVGVAFLASHDHYKLPFGYSLDGQFKDARGRGAAAGMRTIATFYTIPDLEQGGVKTNEWIRATSAGINRDVSVGFYLDQDSDVICDLDGMSYLGSDCRHWLGMKYKASETDETLRIATATVDGAHLSEVSSVYDGASPGAMITTILKAQRAADAGELEPATARSLEALYGTRIRNADHLFAGLGLGRERDEMPPRRATRSEPETEDDEEEAAEQLERTETLEETDATGSETPPAATETEGETRMSDYPASEINTALALADDATIDQVRATIASLTARAADGSKYRTALIEEALTEHKRAFGDKATPDSYRAMLDAAPIEAVVTFRDHQRSIGDQTFKPGRQTVDEEEQAKQKSSNGRAHLPATAYR